MFAVKGGLPEGKNPVTEEGGLPVALAESRGRRPEAVEFKTGSGNRPEADALRVFVKFTVGNGMKPDHGKVEFAVELAVGTGKRPDLGLVEFAVTLEVGFGRPDMVMMGPVALTLGKMPAEPEKAGYAVMFSVGKGRLEKGKLEALTRAGLPVGGYPELGVETVELGNPRLVKDKVGWKNVG